MTGVAKKTVMRVLVEVGAVCAGYQDYAFRNLTTKRLQLDEMWAWIYCKEILFSSSWKQSAAEC